MILRECPSPRTNGGPCVFDYRLSAKCVSPSLADQPNILLTIANITCGYLHPKNGSIAIDFRYPRCV